MYPSSSDGLNTETETAVYFFTPAFHALDNFSAHAIDLWGQRFLTAEQAYQWKKFSEMRPDIAEEIARAMSPEAAQHIARVNKTGVPTAWHAEKVTVMTEILRAKYDQHADVRETLQRTGQRDIIENTPADYLDTFWGIGRDKNGQNMIGKIWMKIRAAHL